ncbi:MAG TPA: urease accessory UreF family protein [Candidatus Acidoferrum sp.]|nr:urease accessory UreF family protein [Candidatus Acidoferrum sp.]
MKPSEELAHLRLLHLADSALPIGSLAHSFGLETLVSAELLQVGDLPEFLQGYLQEAGMLEATACREAFQLARLEGKEFGAARWIEINDYLSVLKPARESRAASATLGRNFLRAALGLGDFRVLQEAQEVSLESSSLIHQSAAFGLVSGVLGFDETRAVLAYLHQMSACLISACQRLMPLGQTEATRILWNLKPAMLEVATDNTRFALDTANCTTPLLDWGAMEHPALATRLFVS